MKKMSYFFSITNSIFKKTSIVFTVLTMILLSTGYVDVSIGKPTIEAQTITTPTTTPTTSITVPVETTTTNSPTIDTSIDTPNVTTTKNNPIKTATTHTETTIPTTEIIPIKTVPTETIPIETIPAETVPTETIPTETLPFIESIPAPNIISVNGSTSTISTGNNRSPEVVVNGVQSGDLVSIYNGVIEVGNGTSTGDSIIIVISELSPGSHLLTAETTRYDLISASSNVFDYTYLVKKIYIYSPQTTEQTIYDWSNHFGEIYSIDGAQVKVSDSISTNGNTACYFDTDFGTSYSVEVTTDATSGGFAIGVGNTGGDVGYWLYIESDSVGYIKSRPDWSDLASFNPKGCAGTWKFVVDGTSLKGYKDNIEICSTTIAELPISGGTFYNATVDNHFYNLTISEP